MKNFFVIDRARYDQYMSVPWLPKNGIGGIPRAVVMFLDFFIIEEADSSATFLKNRYNHQNTMTKQEYELFKKEYMN